MSKVTIVIQHKPEFTCPKTLSGKTSYYKYFKYGWVDVKQPRTQALYSSEWGSVP